ncbi:F-box protein At5g06550-like [Panicum virgatum]|uniref:F-box protein At5g06550-like n=1 Tax=Panicum virgatum TaxID=38727 RepID=UPI0019D5CE0B|nr:F-box protein At5g06550-like [Panicum virgatum]
MPGAFRSLLLPLLRKRKPKRRRSRSHPKESNKPKNHLAAAAGGGGAGDPSFSLKASASASPRDIGFLVQPLGNLLLSASPGANLRDAGLGALRPLPDDLLLDALYVVAAHDPLWRALVLDELGGAFDFAGSWRATYLAAASGGRPHLVPPRALRIRGFYSDYLFQSWLCANMEMRHEWLARDNIERRRGVSVEQFIAEVEEPNRPVLLEGCIDGWPALQKWSREYLLEISAGKEFAVTVAVYVFWKSWPQEESERYLAAAILLFIPGILKCILKPWDLKRVSINSLVDSSASEETDAINSLENFIQKANDYFHPSNNNEASA